MTDLDITLYATWYGRGISNGIAIGYDQPTTPHTDWPHGRAGHTAASAYWRGVYAATHVTRCVRRGRDEALRRRRIVHELGRFDGIAYEHDVVGAEIPRDLAAAGWVPVPWSRRANHSRPCPACGHDYGHDPDCPYVQWR